MNVYSHERLAAIGRYQNAGPICADSIWVVEARLWHTPGQRFRLGFTNGLMSESMILWFSFMLILENENRDEIRRMSGGAQNG